MSNKPVPGLAQKMADFYFARDSSFGPLVYYGRAEAAWEALTYAEKHFRAAHPDAGVRRFTAEQFKYELIRLVHDGGDVHACVRQLAETDLFVMDGFDAVSGNVVIQEELYWILDALHEHGRRVVIGMSRPPKDIPGLEDRVRTQLEGGLLCNLRDGRRG